MKMYMYSLFDTKASVYLPPFCVRAPGEATRMIADLVNDPQSNIGKHPEDYSLWHVGFWDDEDGRPMVDGGPVHMIGCVQLRQS